MTGREFAELINKYETDHHHKPHKFGVIKANPEQSKHLETATMHLGIGWVDFVNLRAETYSEHSRIPQVVSEESFVRVEKVLTRLEDMWDTIGGRRAKRLYDE